jgi:hypothetical protein
MSSEENCFDLAIAPELKKFGFKSWFCDWQNKEYHIELEGYRLLKVPYTDGEDAKEIADRVKTEVGQRIEKDLAATKFTKIALAIDFAIVKADKEAYRLFKNAESTDKPKRNKRKPKQESDKEEEEISSPIELESQHNKKKFYNVVDRLHRQFKSSNLTYLQWQEKVAAKYKILQDITSKHFPDAWEILEFTLSVKSILNMQGQETPFMGVLLAVPSSMKTAILELFREYPITLYRDSISPNAFVSSSSNKTEEELQATDLLPQFTNSFVVTPELAPLFTLDKDMLANVFGKLIRLLDGKGLSVHTGAHGLRGYPGRMFTWIGAIVEIPSAIWRIFEQLGFKIYFYRPTLSKPPKENLQEIATKETFSTKTDEIKIALLDYLTTFDSAVEDGENLTRLVKNTDDNEEKNGRIVQVKWNTEDNEEQSRAAEYIVNIAELLAYLRSTVHVKENKIWNRNTQEEEPGKIEDEVFSDYHIDASIREQPYRAVRLLRNLAVGHAFSQGRDSYNMSDIPVVIKTGLSSAKKNRVLLFQALIENKGTLTTDEVCRKLSFSAPTARFVMREFEALQLVKMTRTGYRNRGYEITLNSYFNWFLNDEFRNLGIRLALPKGVEEI